LADILRFALKEAVAAGARDAEAYLTSSRDSEVFIENNNLKQAKSNTSHTLGIRVLLDGGCTGFYSLNQPDREKVAAAAVKAVHIARVSPKDKNNRLPSARKKFSLLSGLHDRNASSFEASDAARHAVEMLETARSLDSRVSVDSGEFGSSVFAQTLANTSGVYLSEKISTFYWSIMGMAIDGDDVSSYDVQSAGTHRVKDIDVTEVANDFSKTVVQSLGARKIESFKGEMLLTPSAALEILGDVLAHSVNSESVQRKSSKFAGKLGRRVASDLLTLEDDATNTEGLAAASFDREGLPHRRNVVIRNGILERFLYNTYTASKEGVKSTANAVGSAMSPPSVATTNLIISAGRTPLDSLISEINRGVLVSRFSGNVNPVTGDFSGVVKGGRIISGGVLGKGVRELMVAGNAFESLKRLTGLSKERKVLYSAILPYMRISAVSFTAG
jgi:PmbA protein